METETINSNASVSQGEMSVPQSNETAVKANQEARWEDDKRYNDFWAKDPNKLFSSYKSLESKLQDNGKKIKEYETKVKELTDSSQSANQVLSFFNKMQSHPEYSSKLSELVDNFEKAMTYEAYGAELPPHIINELEEAKLLKEQLKEAKYNSEVSQYSEQLDTYLSEIGDIAKKYNVDYSEDDFLSWCIENDVKIKDMKAYFLSNTFDAIQSSIKKNTQEQVIKNIQNNQMASLSAEKNKNIENAPMTLRQAMLKALN